MTTIWYARRMSLSTVWQDSNLSVSTAWQRQAPAGCVYCAISWSCHFSVRTSPCHDMLLAGRWGLHNNQLSPLFLNHSQNPPNGVYIFGIKPRNIIETQKHRNTVTITTTIITVATKKIY